jgi:integrase
MNKIKTKNELIKRRYFNWMALAKGYSEKTIMAHEFAIWRYEDFTKDADYRDFNERVAEGFRRYLATNKNPKTKKVLSLTSQYHALRYVNSFFLWLSGQPGFKSKIRPDQVECLRLSKKESRVANSSKHPDYPTIEFILSLCRSIKVKNEIDRRDRALIAFTSLSGMRDLAIISLPIGCYDPESKVIEQEPAKGVKTKFSKQIITRIFEFNDELYQYFIDWYNYLLKEKLFKLTDPLFPRSKVEHEDDNSLNFISKDVEPVFWSNAGAMRKIFKARCVNANLSYFSPHRFRHFAINKAYKAIQTAEEMKAVSQNVGHENIATTFTYGNIESQRVTEVIGKMDFQDKEKEKIDEQLKQKIQEILMDLKKPDPSV